MKTRSSWGASLLAAVLSQAGPGLAQDPPPMIAPPVVEIVTPRDGTLFLAPADLRLCATADFFTDAVARVEFFAGAASLGVVTNPPAPAMESPAEGPGGSESPRWAGPGFCLDWTNVPPGAYALAVIATDLAGQTASSAAVGILVVTNLPPRVVLTMPHDGATILGPTDLRVCARAFDPDGGTVTQVEFLEGTNSLGVVTNVPDIYVTNRHGVFPIEDMHYCLTWNNVPPGAYRLTALATDNDGAVALSESVDISVVTNLPPRVRIESPEEGARYSAPASVDICVLARDPDGTVASVEFFEGTNSLGVVTNSTAVTNEGKIYGLFCFTWSGVAVGDYTLTALAADLGGATAISAPVGIRVGFPLPPSVSLTTDGMNFVAPAHIWICAAARYFPDPVASVRYFAGATLLGTVSNMSHSCFHWTNVPPGAYALTVTAMDVAGTNIATSPAVNITVRTNRTSGRR